MVKNIRKALGGNRRQREKLREYFQKDQCINYIKTEGCKLHKSDCDSCTHFIRRQRDEPKQTGWTLIREVSPEQLLERRTG